MNWWCAMLRYDSNQGKWLGRGLWGERGSLFHLFIIQFVSKFIERCQFNATGAVAVRRNAFGSFLKCEDELVSRTVAGRLFQTHGSATENNQGRSEKFVFLGGGINFYCTILQSYILTSSAAVSAQNNFQGLWWYMYRYPSVATALKTTGHRLQFASSELPV